MLIREVILENFMSYDYARIPFKAGVNVICGPNGAGKSSILLGVSIALGQSYTERSRKLSNLIKWGKDQARVTIVLDNSPRNGKRPVKKFNRDQIFLTRGLRRDGKYWFELDNRAATKRDVERLLAKFSVHPDNLLIIMHQNMTEQFTILSSQEKLKTVEAAVGLEAYRRNVLQAKKKLNRILSEEESVNNLLESAKQTLDYWREQYDRYQQKKQLQIKRRFLERELAWTEASQRELVVSKLEDQLKEEKSELQAIKKNSMKFQNQTQKLHSKLAQRKSQQQKILEELLSIEREKTRNETLLASKTQTIEEMQQLVKNNFDELTKFLTSIKTPTISTSLRNSANESVANPGTLNGAYRTLETTWTQQLQKRNDNLKAQIENYHEQLEKTNKHLQEIRQKVDFAAEEIEEMTTQFIDTRITSAILEYKIENIESQLQKLNKEIKTKMKEYNEIAERASLTGSRIASTRTIDKIIGDIRLIDGYLAALTDVTEEIERMYETYSDLYLNLKEKARKVEENREKALEEVSARTEAWREVMRDLLEDVSVRYQEILSQAKAAGKAKLVDENDIESAGLSILVGFRGSQLIPLDAYTQSGGERSMATMSFLLALQQHVQSPFRAVDEYDVHMDPRNREIITRLLIEQVKGLDSQYLIITPGQITFPTEDIFILTVQSIEGRSRISGLEESVTQETIVSGYLD
ncbi:MAG: AAA family ATPase [Candidatus Bathyarchaeota archaeon]|nr:MAG: AAA family ATPase [Candidatus Bathyarchaeota archaeon]